MSAIAARRSRPLTAERVWWLVWRGVIYAVTVVLAVIFTFPFFWMVSSSVKPASEIMALPATWIPSEIVFDSYVIRRAALNDQIPTYTTLAGARAAAVGLSGVRGLVPYAIQSLHQRLQ